MAIKFNVEPYYDDFELATAVDGLTPKDKYYQVLFRPAHPVQARELTQLQSILQNQVTQFGRHIFEEGSMVIPGLPTYENEFYYVKLDSITSSDVTALEGRIFEGDTSGIQARVVKAVAAENTDPFTLFVKYITADDSNVSAQFTDGEGLTEVVSTGTPITATLQSTDAIGLGSSVSIEDGVYFIDGRFVAVQQQTLILDKYSNDVSFDVGLKVDFTIQTSAGDPTLNDNAAGTPNETAPGAHRYEIKTELVKQAVNGDTYANFVLLFRIVNGKVATKVRASDYSIIEETLAERTFDESGNYTVRPFRTSMKTHPTDNTKIKASIEPSKAYVRGFQVETLDTEEVDVNKARETALFEDASLPALLGNYVDVSNVSGLPDLANYTDIEIHNDTVANQDGGNTRIGLARIRAISKIDASTYRVFLFHIRMNNNEVFDDSRSFEGTGSTPVFTADIELDGGIATIKEPNRNSLVYQLPFDRVDTLNDGASFNFDYSVVKEFTAQPPSGDTVIFNAEALETFNLDEDFILTDQSGNIIGVSSVNATGSPIALSQVTITMTSSPGTNVKLITVMNRTANMIQKQLVNRGVTISASDFNSGNNSLTECDIFRINSVTHDGTDVSEYFTFDSGQRDNFYNVGRLLLKSNNNFTATADLEVDFDYFEHVGGGDFFCVDSYPLNNINYEDIPSFTSANTGQTIELRSAIDFRPRMSDAGDNFAGSTANITQTPEPNSTFNTDIVYYLNRIDKLFIDKDGRFGVVEGVADLNPDAPDDPKDSMVLSQLFVPAYTLTPNEVIINFIDNQRYTMRDIGRLEKRINNLEYYTSLSLLEKEAADKQILDPNTASDRFKNGFLVDSFSSHNVGRVSSQEYRASIDRTNKLLRPTFSEDNVRLIYSSIDSTNVRKTGDLITLDYTEVNLVDQDKASETLNVNPFDVFKWTGSLELSPTSDEWIDTTRRPNVIVDQEGVYDAMLGIIEETDAIGTVWGNWQTNWTGVTRDVDRRAFGSGTGRGFGNRVETTTTTTTTQGQSRQGIESFVVPDTINTEIGDRVVEINFAPFIRSRIIQFRATRMKPNTKVIPFFDNVDVSDFCREESFTSFSDLDNPVLNGKNEFTAHPLGSSDLITNAAGELSGSFFIPNNDSTFFQTGSRVFKLEDVNEETDAAAAYDAKGLIETKENVTISTRVPTIERREVEDNRIVTNTRTRSNVAWHDPLAQSFIVDEEGGAFLTSIEVFFASKDENIPVTLQIREMNQGIPTQTVVPFSEVTLNPSSVSVSDENDTTPDSTKFTFQSPVYLQDNREYCFVLMANTQAYTVWVAAVGGEDYLTNQRISKQPYAGVLFLSQNASTWTPDQNRDMKFKLNRASFTPTSGQLVLNNGKTAPRKLVNNPFTTTNGSSLVRVAHRNNGMFEGDKIVIQGATEANGITAALLNRSGGHFIQDVERDSYVIDVSKDENGNAIGSPETASSTGIDGGNSTTATENMVMDTMYPFIQQLNFPGTNSNWGFRSTLAGNLMTNGGEATYQLASSYSPVIPNQNYTFLFPQLIASEVMENQLLSGTPSFLFRGTLSRPTNRNNLSPVVDLQRCSVIGINNRIDNPGSTSTGGQNVVENFVAETDPVAGSALAKYVTKTVKLNQSSTTLKLFIDVNRPTTTEVEVYYKIDTNEDALEDNNWTLVSPTENIPFTDNPEEFNEVEYTVDTGNAFTVFAIKVVMLTQNTSRIPTVRDLRAIALA